MAKRSAFLALTLAAVALAGCNGQFPVISPIAIGDLTAAICTELEANPATDTSIVQFACSVIDPKSGNVTKQFVYVVPKAQAPAFAAAHAKK
jgi:hypothetical protein